MAQSQTTSQLILEYLRDVDAEVLMGIYILAACLCDEYGSISRNCDMTTGLCSCRSNFGGRDCGTCQDGYYNYPNCDCKLLYYHAIM